MQQIRLLSLILNRDGDWHQVMDDCIRIGIFYLNKVGKLELADWKDFKKLFDSSEEMELRIIRGELPVPGDPDDY